MDFLLKMLGAFKEFGDTKTAWILAISFAFFVGSRLQKKIEQFATKKEFELHRKATYDEKIILEGSISGTLSKMSHDLQRHSEDDDKRFQELDHAWIPQLKSVNDKVDKAKLSLARIEGALNIKKEGD